jgi:uncharacterized protein YgbK (DUF1537 family)
MVGLLEDVARAKRPLFSVGSSGIETALAAQFNLHGRRRQSARTAGFNLPGRTSTVTKLLLVGSGSCSPVTSAQIAWALKHGFAEVALNAGALADPKTVPAEINRAANAATNLLNAGNSVIVHTTKSGSNKRVAAKLKARTAEVLGTALGRVLREAVKQGAVRRVCIAGGDTSSYAARALGIEALRMIAPLTPGAPVCRAHAPGSPADECEVVFKGGQVGAENYFEIIKSGKA